MKPYIVIHSVASINGRITGFESDMALYNFVALIWKPGAMLTSSNTFLSWYKNKKDETKKKPVRSESPNTSDKAAKPILVVVDSRGRIDCWNEIVASSFWKSIVVLCSESTPNHYLKHLVEKGIEYIVTGARKVDLRDAVTRLQKDYRIEVIRVDCGNILRKKLLELKLVDELSFLVYPNFVLKEEEWESEELNGWVETKQENTSLALELIELKKIRKNIVWSRYKVKYTE